MCEDHSHEGKTESYICERCLFTEPDANVVMQVQDEDSDYLPTPTSHHTDETSK